MLLCMSYDFLVRRSALECGVTEEHSRVGEDANSHLWVGLLSRYVEMLR